MLEKRVDKLTIETQLPSNESSYAHVAVHYAASQSTEMPNGLVLRPVYGRELS